LQLSTHKAAPATIGVKAAAFSPDGKLVATTYFYSERAGQPPSRFKAVRVWDVADGHEVASFGNERVFSIVFLPDSQRAIIKPRDRKPELREVRTGKLLATFEDSSPSAQVLALSPDGKLMLTGSSTTGPAEEPLRLVDVPTRKVLRTLEGRYAAGAIFTPDGKTAYVWFYPVQGQDFAFGVYQMPSGKPVRYARREDYELYPLVFSSDGKLALSETPEDRAAPAMSRLVLWDVASGAEVRWLQRRAPATELGTPFSYRSIYCVGFSADGRRVTAFLGDSTLRSWEVATGTQLWAVRVAQTFPIVSAISRDGGLVLTAWGALVIEYGGGGFQIALWDTSDGEFLRVLSGAHPLPHLLDPDK
jgi:WD40 repeat protein